MMCSWSMMTDLGHLEQAGAGERGAWSGAMSSPAAVLRTGYMRRAQALRLMRRHSPRAPARRDQFRFRVRWLPSPK